ncbi:PepSY domain-containing protein [Sphingomonas gilva]|uniref:PepSY domain-containing protein n=1 Tax=Sphingomonas gilva TaxID=2305907 RepID=A0A396RKN3_9SPHN|nr:PepSY domain-containing protein [Sphingomonas gilva]RHW16838.1 PepSY domain-containing protein [Sphingomonas gilva]
MTRVVTRRWYLVHKWTSLVCTAFLLMLCVTGLPLIFHDEIDALTETSDGLPPVADGNVAPSLDAILAGALADRPGHVGLFMSFDEDRPVVNITTGPAPDAPGAQMTLRSYDMRTGDLVGVITEDGVMHFLLQLHTDMFLGLPGMFFLGAMGALFFAAIVSGVVLYAPFMRRLDFGTVRANRSRRIKWIDYHNLLGIVTLAWASVVGLTGVINALEDPIVGSWRASELAEMTGRYAGQAAPAPGKLASIDGALATARAAAPGNWVQFIAFPGGAFSSAHHYAVFMQGDTPLTKGLLRPALIDASTGRLTDIRAMPWYVQALFLSRPLHFGDYGGLPLKILWALLDIFTIIVLASGLYLWLGKRRAPLDARVRELETSGLVPAE